ncbi:MAG: hypothetical protein ABFD16_12090 [Thermoguttaceae bacterium]
MFRLCWSLHTSLATEALGFKGNTMTIGAYCAKCGRIVFATSKKIGQSVTCPGCGAALEIAASISRDEPVNLACPHCASVLRVIRELDGHRIRCTTCQMIFRVSASPWKLTPLEPSPGT